MSLRILFNLAAPLFLAMSACGAQPSLPADLRSATLDPSTAVDRADSIVVATVMGHRDIQEFPTPWRGDGDPKRLAEVEVSLKVIQMIKGQQLPAEVRYRFYDGRGYGVVFGMPKGPSGPVGSTGIFFLARRPDGPLRSLVDVYRPDIEMPWLAGPLQQEACGSPRECIAKLLLTYEKSDDAQAFAGSLIANVPLSRRLVGFLSTFDLVIRLAGDDQPSDVVRHGACRQLALSYALEFPSTCVSLVGDSKTVADAATRGAELREHLKNGGIAWVQRRIGTDDGSAMTRYVELLLNSPDRATRTAAEELEARKQ